MRVRPVVLFSVLVLGAACASSSTPGPAAPTQPRSLYERLGGKDAITAVVGSFVDRLVSDPRLAARFSSTNLPRFKGLLTDQICEATGGPCKYTGKDMVTAHTGMNVTEAEFTALVEDLRAALDQFKVGPVEQGQLLDALGGMKPEIVENGRAALAKRAPAQEGGAKLDEIAERAKLLHEAASLLEKAGAARQRGNRSFADQLFSSAELLLGPQALADLAPQFRDGAPPRIMTPLKSMPSGPPQPVIAGSSDADEPDEKPSRGSLAGTVAFQGPGGGVAVVTLEPASGKFRKRTPRQRIVEQRGRQFAPRLLVVPVGSTVSFPNFDPIFHNVFSRSDTKPFDLGYYKNGQSREVVFDKEGIVRLGCNLHANMSAHVAIVSAPHYTVTDDKGRFFFRSLAPGRYTLRLWSERVAAPLTRTVVIQPDKNSIALTMVADAPVTASIDKFGAVRDGKAR